jgi:Reverse transcriptase (RNA-dependent DNA polymerase)
VQHSEWVALIVVVPKANGSVRICGDFKVTFNPHLNVDQYPLPVPEDLFASLERCKWFTKLDLSQAYLQLELDEESQQIYTVNTPLGLFQYFRMPFGPAPAPAKFQRVMDDLTCFRFLIEFLLHLVFKRVMYKLGNVILICKKEGNNDS